MVTSSLFYKKITIYMLWLLIIYFNFLIITAYIVNKKNKQDNLTFFRGKRKTPWYIISIGMISSSISGISLISVPGMVQQSNFAYMQMVFGFFVGYIIIAYILLPLYYKLNLISIYGYLNNRFGQKTYKTGVSFFLLAKLLSTSTKLYLVAFLLHQFIFI
ncbi:MAG: sodium:solute symporter, partial [Paludibacteraceae bacterium]|nr:sodium:solute symporter [Paludibacteraceae bacterium]